MSSQRNAKNSETNESKLKYSIHVWDMGTCCTPGQACGLFVWGLGYLIPSQTSVLNPVWRQNNEDLWVALGSPNPGDFNYNPITQACLKYLGLIPISTYPVWNAGSFSINYFNSWPPDTNLYTDCSCGALPPPPNGVRSCCDPTIQYTIDPSWGGFNTATLGMGIVGQFAFPIGSTPPYTHYGCWEVIHDSMGPLVGGFAGSGGAYFPDCDSIDLQLYGLTAIDECCPSATTECNPQLITPLIKRLETFKKDRNKLLNKELKYTEKSIKQLTDLGYGPRDKSTGGPENPSGGPPPGEEDRWMCVDGECMRHEDGNYDHVEACLAACGEDGPGSGGVPEECCTWCCHASRGETIAPSGCLDWMCGGDYCVC